MTKHFEHEVTRIKRQVLSLSALVEEAVYKAVKAVTERNLGLANEVIDGDHQVDVAEVELEEECLKILALHQPVAIDLRFVVAVLKMDNELERIGDLAVNIAHRARSILKFPESKVLVDFVPMATKVRLMLKECIESLVNMDVNLANNVCEEDDQVDKMNREMHEFLRTSIRGNIEDLDSLTYMMSVSKNLERIADHTTNIAEDVIYMVEGKIIRHGVNAG